MNVTTAAAAGLCSESSSGQDPPAISIQSRLPAFRPRIRYCEQEGYAHQIHGQSRLQFVGYEYIYICLTRLSHSLPTPARPIMAANLQSTFCCIHGGLVCMTTRKDSRDPGSRYRVPARENFPACRRRCPERFRKGKSRLAALKFHTYPNIAYSLY